MVIAYLPRRNQHTSQSIQRYQRSLSKMIFNTGLQIKQGNGGTHKLREVMK